MYITPASSAKLDILHLLVSGIFGIIGASRCGVVQAVSNYNLARALLTIKICSVLTFFCPCSGDGNAVTRTGLTGWKYVAADLHTGSFWWIQSRLFIY